VIVVLLEIVSFTLFLIFGLFFPGQYLLSKLNLKLNFPANIFASTVFGLVFFTLINYAFSWLHLEILSLLVILIILVLAIKEKNLVIPFERKELRPILIVLVLCLIFSSSMVITGVFGNSIIVRQDDLWHLALINEMKANFPPDNPGFAEVPLKGYHFFYNFLAAKISNLFLISPLSLHFHFLPLLFALLWGFGTYSLVINWTKKVSTALIAVILTLFGGGFSYLLVLQGHAGFSWDAGYGMNQPFGSLYNPPLSISIGILLFVLVCLFEYIQTKNKNWLVPLTLAIGVISMFKVYAGMIVIGGFLFFALYELFNKRFWILISLFTSGIIFIFTYWIFVGGTGYLILYPFWPFQRILESFPWYGYDEKMATYSRLNVIKGVVGLEVDGFKIFILGNLGTRILGLLVLPLIFIKNKKIPSIFAITVFIMLLISILIPMFFIQSGKVFEIIQMANYFLFFVSLFAALGFSYLLSLRMPRFLKILIILIIVVLTSPAALEGFSHFPSTLAKTQPLNSPQFQAFKFLSEQANYNSTVLELPTNDWGYKVSDLKRWYEQSTPIVSAFSNKRTFLNNEFISFPGLNVDSRVNSLADIVRLRFISASTSAFPFYENIAMNTLHKNKIKYIFTQEQTPNYDKTKGLKKIYSNSPYAIYQVID